MAIVYSNRISYAPSDEGRQVIRSAVQALQETLQPLLVDLGVEDRRALPKMGIKTVDFVAKALKYARENPEFKPGFVDLDEFARDLAAVEDLRALLRPLSQLTDMVEDSLMLSGSEAYAAALSYYQAAKAAARVGHPGAAVIAEDLGRQFVGRGPKPAGQPGTTPPAAAAR